MNDTRREIPNAAQLSLALKRNQNPREHPRFVRDLNLFRRHSKRSWIGHKGGFWRIIKGRSSEIRLPADKKTVLPNSGYRGVADPRYAAPRCSTTIYDFRDFLQAAIA
jgi:ribosomal protein L32E